MGSKRLWNGPIRYDASGRSVTLVLLALLLLWGGVAQADGLAPELRQSIDGAVEKEMKRMEAVGVAIGIIRHAKVIYTAGYGFADREGGIPVTTKSMFRWASLSKPLTAVVAMQLVEQKRLDLDADVRKLVPEFPDKGDPITTRQLLGHFAGIVHYKNGPIIPTKRDYAVPHPYKDVVLALDIFNASPLVAKPGTTYAYSSHGYILASAAIERAGKMPYAQQVLERIAKPLGLSSLQPDYQWVDIPGRVTGYRRVEGSIVRTPDNDVSRKLGGGGWISNIDDLARFAAGLLQGGLVSDASREAMWTRQKTSDGATTPYGLGFSLGKGEGKPAKVWHRGAQKKTRTRIVLYPNQGHGLVVMSNSEYAEAKPFAELVEKMLNSHPNIDPSWRTSEASETPTP